MSVTNSNGTKAHNLVKDRPTFGQNDFHFQIKSGTGDAHLAPAQNDNGGLTSHYARQYERQLREAKDVGSS